MLQNIYLPFVADAQYAIMLEVEPKKCGQVSPRLVWVGWTASIYSITSIKIIQEIKNMQIMCKFDIIY